jgi:hypothetical protein
MLSHWALGGIGPSTTIVSLQQRSSWLIRNGIPRFVVCCVAASYVLVLVERLCSSSSETSKKVEESDNGGSGESTKGPSTARVTSVAVSVLT